MSLQQLRQKIENHQAQLGVIGLGYVGLPVAASFARAGYHVTGIDRKAERVATINAGRSPIEGEEPGLEALIAEVVGAGMLRASTAHTDLADADIVLINVETPVDATHRPRYEALRAACASLGEVLKPGALVIVESTIAPGTVETVVRPLLEATTRGKANVDFFLGACPERVMPGKLLSNLREMSRVCGGGTPETAETMAALYRQIVAGEIDPVDTVTAELVKTTENAYRDVQIAFANEVALICESVGADVWRVRELVNKSPYRQMHLPGVGVGGHCIPKDPWLLASAAMDTADIRLIPAARAVNEAMPAHVAELTAQALRDAGVPVERARVAVLGYAYLENSDDTRNSPSEPFVNHLRALGAEVVVHDPWVEQYAGDMFERIAGADAVAVLVGHQPYRTLDMDALRAALRTPVLVDGRGLFDPAQVQAAGFMYRGVGYGNR